MTLSDRKFYEHYDREKSHLVRVYCCPCCGYPTVGEPPSYDICEICSWEDDGCDGGGPNACGLSEAQEYFRCYLTSYSPAHEYSPQFQTPTRRFVHESECSTERLAYKRGLMSALETYMAESDLHRRGELWQHLPKE